VARPPARNARRFRRRHAPTRPRRGRPVEVPRVPERSGRTAGLADGNAPITSASTARRRGAQRGTASWPRTGEAGPQPRLPRPSGGEGNLLAVGGGYTAA